MKCKNCCLRYHCDEQTEFNCTHNNYSNYKQENDVRQLTWLEKLELTKAMMGRGVSYEVAEQILIDFQTRMERF